MKTEVVTVRLDPKVKERLKILAEATDRTPAYLVGRAVESYLAEQEWQIKAILGGIAGADRGEFASEEQVRNAFGKWGVRSED